MITPGKKDYSKVAMPGGVLGGVRGTFYDQRLEDRGWSEESSKDAQIYNRSSKINPTRLKKNPRYEITPDVFGLRGKIRLRGT